MALRYALISEKAFIKSSCQRQFSYKSVDVSFISTNIKNRLTNLRGN